MAKPELKLRSQERCHTPKMVSNKKLEPKLGHMLKPIPKLEPKEAISELE